MAEKTTFIKLDRNIINWRWYGEPKVLSVFIWLIIKANIRKGHFEKDVIERGSLVTSNAHIAEGCNLTIQNVRTALAHLEETGEIVRNQRHHYQIITITNYELYQTGRSNLIGQLTGYPDGNQQATNRQLTTIKEYKNKRMERKKEIPPKSPTGGRSPDGVPERGTDAFRAKSHLLLKPEEGTVDDIPLSYRDRFDSFAEYHNWRNQ